MSRYEMIKLCNQYEEKMFLLASLNIFMIHVRFHWPHIHVIENHNG